MKRFIPLILILALLFCGCQPAQEIQPTAPAVPAPETEPQATDTTQEEPTAATEPQAPIYDQQTMVAVSMPCIQEFTRNDAGEVVFRHSYQTMQLTVQDPDVANSIILDYLAKIETVHQTAAQYSDAALAAHPGAGSDPYFYDVFYSPARIDQNVLSLGGVSNVYVDGRPGQTGVSASYNMLTGEVLTLGSILNDVSAKDDLVDLVIAAADAVSENTELFDDYADCIAERFAREESFDEDWYFTETGLVFYFSAYEIAPYNSGMVTLEVPYPSLTGIIADAFFPPEAEKLTGSLQVHLLGEVDLSGFSQIAEIAQVTGEVSLDTEPEKYLIYADGAVQNLHIQYGALDESGTVFIPSCTIFASAALTPGDAVMLHTFLTGMPTVQITYQSGGQEVVQYLTESGENGSVILTEG